MRVLITGGTGGLGRAIVEFGAARTRTLRIQSRRPPPARSQEAAEWAGADLATGEGLAAALAGVDAVIHAASDFRRPREVDVEGTRRLLAAARAAGVRHLIYVSIVGVDQIPYAYYRAKRAAEVLVEQGGVPWSILRATQFHSLVDGMLAAAVKLPLVMPVATRFRFQTVDTQEVAARLLAALDRGPAGRLRDFGGPEVMTLGDMAAAWRAARGVGKPVLPLPLPGRLAAAFRSGKNTAPLGDRGAVGWREWLGRRPPAPDARAR